MRRARGEGREASKTKRSAGHRSRAARLAPPATCPGAWFRREPLRALRRVARDKRLSGWVVGGAVRDLWLGRPPADWDIAAPTAEAANAWCRELERRGFGRPIPIGREPFPLQRFSRPGGPTVDVSRWLAPTLAGDLGRRDFSMNAMALDLATGELIDPYDGTEHLSRGILVALRPDNFLEDPLRALRGARFLSEMPLRLEARTARIIRQAAPGLCRVAQERLRAELLRLLAGPRASAALLEAARLGLLGPALGYQKPIPTSCLVAPLTRLERNRRTRLLSARECALVRLAILLNSAGERPATARERLKQRFSRDEIRTVASLLAAGRRRPAGSEEAWRWAFECAPHAAITLAYLRAIRPGDPAVAALARRLAQARGRRPPATGGDVSAWLGGAQGQRIGDILEELRLAVFRGQVRNRRQARRFVAARASD